MVKREIKHLEGGDDLVYSTNTGAHIWCYTYKDYDLNADARDYMDEFEIDEYTPGSNILYQIKTAHPLMEKYYLNGQ